MNHLRRIFTAVATLAGAVLALAATPAAFAMQVPPPGEGSGIAPPPPPVRVIAEGGMPGWQITLIALAAALAHCRDGRPDRPRPGVTQDPCPSRAGARIR